MSGSSETTDLAGFDLSSDFFDPSLVDVGVWIPFFSGSSLHLAAYENKRHQAERTRLARSHRLQLDQANEDATGLVMRITCQALAKHVLLGWKGIKINGEFVPYTVENGMDALMRSQKLRDFVTEQSQLASNFQVKDGLPTPEPLRAGAQDPVSMPIPTPVQPSSAVSG